MQTNRIFIVGCIMLISMFGIAQEQDNRYQDLKTKMDSIRVDSTTFGELYGAQLDEIVLDYKQINDALKIKIDSLNQTINSMQNKELKTKNKSSFMFYGLLVSSALLLIFLILFFVFMLKSSKKQKLLKQTNLELGKLKTEVDKLNSYINSEKEQHQFSLNAIENEKNQVLTEFKRVTNEFETSKKQSLAKEEELNKKINEINQEYSRLMHDYESLKNELTHQLAKNEETAQEINELKEEIGKKTSLIFNAEQELIAVRQTNESLTAQLTEYKNENQLLRQQIIEANETKEKVNNELKKFVEELQTMLPLPKK